MEVRTTPVLIFFLQEEEEEARYMQETILTFTGQRFWIGLVDRDTEGVWKWLNGTSPTYKDWAPNEPNAYHQSDDCACLAKDYNNQWIDEDCEKTYYLAICEKRYHDIVPLYIVHTVKDYGTYHIRTISPELSLFEGKYTKILSPKLTGWLVGCS